MFAISYFNTITNDIEMTYGFETLHQALRYTTEQDDGYIAQNVYVWDDVIEEYIFVRKAYTQEYLCAPNIRKKSLKMNF